MHQLSAHKTGLKGLVAPFLWLAGLSGLVFFAVYGNFDTNEGWYANDVYLMTRGEKPYLDFFYHRLPLFLYSFLPFLAVLPLDWINLRLICAGFYAAGILLLYLILRRRDPGLGLMGVALATFNPAALHIYSTVQSYSFIAFLFLFAIWLAERNLSSDFPAVLGMSLILVIAQWSRYPLDFIPIAFVCYLFIVYGKKPNVLLAGLGSFILFNAILFAIFRSETFQYDLLLGMFPLRAEDSLEALKLPGNDWNTWLRYKSEWVTLGARWFLPLIFLFVFSALAVRRKFLRLLARPRLEFWRDRKSLTLSLLLIGGNTSMNLLAPEGHVVQMFFVYPLLILLGLRLMEQASISLLAGGIAATLGVFLILPQNDFRWPREIADTSLVRKISADARKVCGNRGEIFTFTPIVAMEAGLRIMPGMEFETFGYFEKMETKEALKYRLLNKEILFQRLKGPFLCAIHVDNRLLTAVGNAARLRHVKEALLAEIENKYQLAVNLVHGPETIFRGPVRIYASPASSF